MPNAEQVLRDRVDLEDQKRALEAKLKTIDKAIGDLNPIIENLLISDGNKGKITLYGYTIYTQKSIQIAGPKDASGKLDRHRAVEFLKSQGLDYLITYDHMQIRAALKEFINDETGELELPSDFEGVFSVSETTQVKMRKEK